MIVTCAVCTKGFEAQRSTAKYCSARCRQLAKRRRSDPAAASDQQPSELVAAVRKELIKFRRLDTVDGQLAIELAIKITTPGMTGVAGLSKELRSVRNQIRTSSTAPTPSGPKPKDQVALMRERRERKARQAQAR